jgi:retron-type reverse transcriptase
MELIQRRVSDPIILELIRKGLKAKVFPYGGEGYIPELGTPQGGILSPLLSNIYLHELDKRMETLGKEYQGTKTSKNRKRNPLAMKLLKAGKKSSYYGRNISYYDPNDGEYINCKYVRYADDFIIGIAGNRKMAEEIRDKVKAFLEEELKVELSLEKTHITHISKGIPFLGYKFSRRTIFIRQRY